MVKSLSGFEEPYYFFVSIEITREKAMSIDEGFPERAHSTDPTIGQRAWYLEEARGLENELGFSTSNFTVVSQQFFESIGVDGPHVDVEAIADMVERADDVGFRAAHQQIAEYFAGQLAPHLPEMRSYIQSLNGEPIIVRPSPLDESGRPDLSFAGVCRGYMPLKPMSRDEHLVRGTATMLAGRITKHGNAYYDRHGITGDRTAAAIYMEPFFELGKDIPPFYGTAYVAGDHIRNEYHVSPAPDQPQRDPRLTVERGGQTWHDHKDQSAEDAHDFTGRISRLMSGLQQHFNVPLDVEYLVAPQGDLYVVQIRQISDAHRARWQALPAVDEAAVRHRSAVINSVGTAEGRVIDLRTTVEGVRVDDLQTGITVINHEPLGRGMHSQALFQLARTHNLQNLRVVVDHGESRLRDHLQYALAEDPGINFIVQTTDPAVTRKLRNGAYAQVVSNGVSAEVQTTA